MTQVNKNVFMKLMMAFMLIFTVVGTIGVVLSTDVAYAADGKSMDKLQKAADNAVKDELYTSKKGDTIKGSAIVKNGITNDRFQELTSKEQQRLIDDMVTGVNKKQTTESSQKNVQNPITENTKTNWLKELQQQPGVGSKLMNNITEQIKPDYVTGQRIFEPFAGPINTVIALIAIILMSFLAVTLVADLAFLTIPAFQAMVLNAGDGNGSGGGRGKSSFFVGREAIQSLEESENSSDGGSKSVYWTYLKKRFVGLLLLGVCLLYLVQGQIFLLVSMLMDLLGGFLE